MGYRKHQNEGHRELHEIVNPEDEWKHDWNHKPFPWQHHDEPTSPEPKETEGEPFYYTDDEMVEYLNDPAGARFWQVHFGGISEVEFGDFTNAMGRYFGRQISPKDRTRLRSAIDFTGNGIVKAKDFKKFLAIMGPFDGTLRKACDLKAARPRTVDGKIARLSGKTDAPRRRGRGPPVAPPPPVRKSPSSTKKTRSTAVARDGKVKGPEGAEEEVKAVAIGTTQREADALVHLVSALEEAKLEKRRLMHSGFYNEAQAMGEVIAVAETLEKELTPVEGSLAAPPLATSEEAVQKVVYKAIYRSVCLATIDKTKCSAALEDLAQALVEGFEATSEKRQDVIENSKRTTAMLMHDLPKDKVANMSQMGLRHMVDNLREAQEGTLLYNDSPRCKSTVLFYQANILQTISTDWLYTDAMKQQVDRFSRYLRTAAEEKRAAEYSKDDNCALKFETEVQSQLIQKGGALDAEVMGLEHELSEGETQMEMYRDELGALEDLLDEKKQENKAAGDDAEPDEAWYEEEEARAKAEEELLDRADSCYSLLAACNGIDSGPLAGLANREQLEEAERQNNLATEEEGAEEPEDALAIGEPKKHGKYYEYIACDPHGYFTRDTWHAFLARVAAKKGKSDPKEGNAWLKEVLDTIDPPALVRDEDEQEDYEELLEDLEELFFDMASEDQAELGRQARVLDHDEIMKHVNEADFAAYHFDQLLDQDASGQIVYADFEKHMLALAQKHGKNDLAKRDAWLRDAVEALEEGPKANPVVAEKKEKKKAARAVKKEEKKEAKKAAKQPPKKEKEKKKDDYSFIDFAEDITGADLDKDGDVGDTDKGFFQ